MVSGAVGKQNFPYGWRDCTTGKTVYVGKTGMSAYSELYLDDAMQNPGDMIEYAVCGLG